MEAERVRVAMFSTMIFGGAGYAALRVHDALRLGGADSTLYVGRAERTKHPGVVRLRNAEQGAQPPWVPGRTIFSVDPPGIPDAELDRIIATADIFNLHWCARFLSLRNIEHLSRSGKPLVLTVRDMNPLAGGCHFFHGCENWKRDCSLCPQFIPDDLPLPHATLEAKRTLWDFDNIAVVVLSNISRRLVKQSPLLGQCRIEKIPNPIDVSIFKPQQRERARAEFGVPPGRKAIAYLPSFSSSVKGGAQAMGALRQLATTLSADDCVVICAGDLEAPLDVPFETINAGFISDKQKLARFYASADVTLIPSLEETFSNTAAESVACGTPIVGFKVGAIPEIAQGKRGRVVPIGDVNALAEALRAMFSDTGGKSEYLHGYVTQSFSAEAISRQYLKLFGELLCSSRAHTTSVDSATQQPSPAIQLFNRLLSEYRLLRSREPRKRRETWGRRAGSVNWGMSLVWRGICLFFVDNAAFRRRLRTFLEGWR